MFTLIFKSFYFYFFLQQNEFLLSVESEQVSLTMNLDLNGDKAKKGNGIPDWGTTRKRTEDIKREKVC